MDSWKPVLRNGPLKTTIGDLADLAGVSWPTMSKWLDCPVKMPLSAFVLLIDEVAMDTQTILEALEDLREEIYDV